MKVIVAGSRTITDYQKVKNALSAFEWEITEIVSGGANGVDKMGERWAIENKIPLRRFPAKWDLHGKSAGPIRNREMAEYADALVAIWDGKSKGTYNMIEEANRNFLYVWLSE